MIKVYQNSSLGKEKKGRWFSPKIVLVVELKSRDVSIPARGEKKIATVAFEVIWMALRDDTLAQAV